ncbi:MAG: 6-phosphogluconolactonase [Chthoniobacterales bacterium]
MKTDIKKTQDLVRDTVALIESEAEVAIATRGRFILSLSGGNTPKPIYAELAKRNHDWSKWIFTFGDERCVPPEDEQSNFRMVNEVWFAPAGVPESSIFRMKGEEPPAQAALEYERAMNFLSENEGGEILRHDLILLGMGPDGHTASLFPGTPALNERTRLVIENFVPKFDMYRITFTYPFIDAARHVVFALASKGKETVLDDLKNKRGDYPCQHIAPTDGTLTWIIAE